MIEEKEYEHWDQVIRPESPVFSLKLREVWEYRDLLVLLVKRDVISFYKQTVLGPLWFFIQPLIMTLIYMLIFGTIAGIGTDGLPKALFYMTGIISWNYFSECLLKTSTIFKDNAHIMGKVYFPRLVMPLSIITGNLVRFGVQFVLLAAVILYFVILTDYEYHITPYLLLLPALVLLMALLSLGLGLIITSITTKYRDLAYLVTFGVQLLMYATPVIYPLSATPESIRPFIAYNPLTPIVEGMRLAILGKGELELFSLLSSVGFTVIVLFFGMIIFNKAEKSFSDSI
ncbi:MAG: Transport permease protein [Crocinitomicaceae bacterium]|jgi:lipopolysaccharide transport system permease protein|nr:Transport permease protein [Crocinitomicaceae bacterium]